MKPRPSSILHHPSSTTTLRPHRRQHFSLVEAEEALLVRPDLVHVDVVVARLLVFTYFCDVLLWVGAAQDCLGNRVLCDELGSLLEVLGKRQLRTERAGDTGGGPP